MNNSTVKNSIKFTVAPCLSNRVTGIFQKKRVHHLQIKTLAETVNGITSGLRVSKPQAHNTNKNMLTNDRNWMLDPNSIRWEMYYAVEKHAKLIGID